MIIINKVENHEKHKASLLSKIDILKEVPGLPFWDIQGQETPVMPGVYSDWSATPHIEREYLEEFYDLIDPVMENIAESLGFLAPKYLIRDYRMGITKIWFNQYSEGGEHDWHNHPGCQFTNCYYLELPDVEYATEVIGADGKLCKIHATEGDVMTCPAWMKHRSKPNGPERKTIIAWNSNYEV